MSDAKKKATDKGGRAPADPAPAEATEKAAVEKAPDATQETAEPEAGEVETGAPETGELQAGEAEPGEVEAGEPEGAAAPPDREAELEAEVASLKDQLLRALAETENQRRRFERERTELAKYAVAGFARDLLSSLDNMRRALDSVPDDADKDDEALKTLLAGVELTERELLQAFEKHGMCKIEPMGVPFDHNIHHAVLQLENTGKPPGTVVQLLQPGYMLHDRLLRPAMVGVAKAAEEAAEEEAAKEEAPEEPEQEPADPTD
ncbi:MAG: nucleotide exchange factor GrpE [Kiloniellales bacterium]